MKFGMEWPSKIWEPETEEQKKKNDAILEVINENIVDEVKKKEPSYYLWNARV